MQINHSDREQSTGHLEQESQTTSLASFWSYEGGRTLTAARARELTQQIN